MKNAEIEQEFSKIFAEMNKTQPTPQQLREFIHAQHGQLAKALRARGVSDSQRNRFLTDFYALNPAEMRRLETYVKTGATRGYIYNTGASSAKFASVLNRDRDIPVPEKRVEREIKKMLKELGKEDFIKTEKFDKPGAEKRKVHNKKEDVEALARQMLKSIEAQTKQLADGKTLYEIYCNETDSGTH